MRSWWGPGLQTLPPALSQPVAQSSPTAQDCVWGQCESSGALPHHTPSRPAPGSAPRLRPLPVCLGGALRSVQGDTGVLSLSGNLGGNLGFLEEAAPLWAPKAFSFCPLLMSSQMHCVLVPLPPAWEGWG